MGLIILLGVIILIYFVVKIIDSKKYRIKKQLDNVEIPGKSNIIYNLPKKFVLDEEEKNIDVLVKKFNQYNHQFFDLEDACEYIINNFDINYVKIFYQLSNNEKFFFFNLCKVYKEGGKVINFNKNKGDFITKNSGDFFFLDQNNFYSTEKNNKKIKKMLDLILTNNYNNITNLGETKVKFNLEKRPELNKIWFNYMLETNINFLKNRKTNKEFNGPRTTLLIRSYKRPEYLEKCLKTIEKLNLDVFYEKIILDDNSDCTELVDIYKKFEKLGFNIKINNINYKYQSFNKMLDLVDKKSDYVMCLDNDMIVKENIYEKTLETYEKIKKICKLENNKILLTSFDFEGHKIINKYRNFGEKKVIGAANLFFSTCLIKKFQTWWEYKKDWGICEKFREEGGRIFVTKKSYCQHIGEKGYNSGTLLYRSYDYAKNF